MQQLVAGRLANVNKGATGEVVRRDAGHRRSSRRRDPPIRLGAAGRRPPPPGGSAAIAPICFAGRAEAPPPAASRRISLSDGVARSTLPAPLQGGGSPMHEAMSASTSARKSARRSTESLGWTTTACARRLASVIHAGSSASVRSGCRIMKCAMPRDASHRLPRRFHRCAGETDRGSEPQSPDTRQYDAAWTGVGKSWLACALGHKACRDNRSVLYQRVPKLFPELALARGDGRYARILRGLTGVQLLILDDWGLEPLDAGARRDLYEILEERYGRRSTILTSQIPVDKWHSFIGEPTTS